MDQSQLELFQIPDEFENNIFENAKKLKQIVQQAYGQIELKGSDKIVLEQYAILNVVVKINHIREAEAAKESTSPRMFIWQYTPLIKLTTSEQVVTVVSTADSLKNTPTKIIPKWINDYFTTDNNTFVKSEFYSYMRQYYTLELLNEVLSDKKVLKNILEIVGKRELLIYVNSKLFANQRNKPLSPDDSSVINKIKNFYSRLRKFDHERCYIIGYYDNFINESELLMQLDDNKYIQSQIEIVLGKIKKSENLYNSYQNDYLFLNNSEFFEVRHNTADWNCKFIMTPSIVNSSFNGLGFSNRKKMQDWDNSREVFCYVRKGGGEYFVRNEILCPNKKLEISKMQEILILSPEYQYD